MLKLSLAIASLLAVAHGLDVIACSGNQPTPQVVTITGCNALPCSVPNLSDFQFTVSFTAPFATSSLTVEARASLLGLFLPYEVPDELRNGCNNINAACPLAAGQTVTLTGRAPVEAPLTGVTITMEFEIVGDGNASVVCFQAPITLT